ncbi:hypothetical protein EJD04_27365 [Salmonella enterica]|nr:hypothetical protein [Salmonella enterica]ECC3212477.1 hypothetical protein [Salmonella enterica subsp. diarizonae]EDQ9751415.1 hypothetical protein [Salmonella enterica subsp. enterica]EDQ3622091.1 hypothetical protein [Salmonella enterica subsp. diarizonae]EEG2673037.1 hypothetical protein [Salmonella enterica]
MNKTIIGLASLVAISVTVHAGGTPREAHSLYYANRVSTTAVAGTVTTTVKTTPLQIFFNPLVLEDKAVEQVAATITVRGSTSDHEYVLDELSAVGPDSSGYYSTLASIGITATADTGTAVTYKAITSDGTDFYIKIVHRAVRPRPGTTVLNFPLIEYAH